MSICSGIGRFEVKPVLSSSRKRRREIDVALPSLTITGGTRFAELLVFLSSLVAGATRLLCFMEKREDMYSEQQTHFMRFSTDAIAAFAENVREIYPPIKADSIHNLVELIWYMMGIRHGSAKCALRDAEAADKAAKAMSHLARDLPAEQYEALFQSHLEALEREPSRLAAESMFEVDTSQSGPSLVTAVAVIFKQENRTGSLVYAYVRKHWLTNSHPQLAGNSSERLYQTF